MRIPFSYEERVTLIVRVEIRVNVMRRIAVGRQTQVEARIKLIDGRLRLKTFRKQEWNNFGLERGERFAA